jgi:hypothetical protein
MTKREEKSMLRRHDEREEKSRLRRYDEREEKAVADHAQSL